MHFVRYALILIMFFFTFPVEAKKKYDRPDISDPIIAVTPVANSRVHLDVGLGSIARESGNATSQEHFSAAFSLVYEYGDEGFGFRMRLPFGQATSTDTVFGATAEKSTFMLGDMNFQFRWKALNKRDTNSYLAVGLEVTMPTSLLNTLGGKRAEILARRTNYNFYRAETGFKLMPIRYLMLGPGVAYAQKVGPVTVGAHILGNIIVACDYANLYESPHVEAILTWELYGAYNILGNRLIEAIIEIGGNHELTQTAGDITSGATQDPTGGVTLTIGARTTLMNLVEVSLGFQLPIAVNDGVSKLKRGADLTTFYRHDWSLILRAGVLLP